MFVGQLGCHFAGRKHQLRIHCANALSAPIVGDAKHGLTRSPEQRRLLKDLQALRQTEPQQAEVLHKDKPAAKKQQQHKQDKFKHHTSSAALYDDPSEGRSELGWTDSALLLQLHAQTICVQKPEAAAIIVEAKPVGQMRLLLRHFSWMPRLTE